jgi:hypothetical protein
LQNLAILTIWPFCISWAYTDSFLLPFCKVFFLFFLCILRPHNSVLWEKIDGEDQPELDLPSDTTI